MKRYSSESTLQVWRKRFFQIFLTLLLAAGLSGTAYQWIGSEQDLASAPPPGRMVGIRGYKLHIWCMGSGTPTAILDSGLGGTAFDWSRVQQAAAAFTQVCTYDRAGLGYSDRGPTPRTSGQIAKELAILIDNAGIKERVVLVGASFGGFNTRIVASQYPEKVAGLVLVDASHEDQGQRYEAAGLQTNVPWYARFVHFAAYTGLLRLAGVTLSTPPELADPSVQRYVRATAYRTASYETARDELLHTRESGAEVAAARRTLTIPLVVISAGKDKGARAGVHRELQQDQLTLSKRSCHVIAENSGHVIQRDQPEAVVDAIKAVIDAAKDSTSKPGC